MIAFRCIAAFCRSCQYVTHTLVVCQNEFQEELLHYLHRFLAHCLFKIPLLSFLPTTSDWNLDGLAIL